MSIFPLDRLMQELSNFLRTPLNFDRGIYRLIVPVAFGRQQEVSASVRSDDEGRAIIAFASTVGAARRGIDAWHLLKLNGDLTYGRIALLGGTIAVVASQLLHTAQPEEVLLILREVAQCADQLERKFFVGDQF